MKISRIPFWRVKKKKTGLSSRIPKFKRTPVRKAKNLQKRGGTNAGAVGDPLPAEGGGAGPRPPVDRTQKRTAKQTAKLKPKRAAKQTRESLPVRPEGGRGDTPESERRVLRREAVDRMPIMSQQNNPRPRPRVRVRQRLFDRRPTPAGNRGKKGNPPKMFHACMRWWSPNPLRFLPIHRKNDFWESSGGGFQCFGSRAGASESGIP